MDPPLPPSSGAIRTPPPPSRRRNNNNAQTGSPRTSLSWSQSVEMTYESKESQEPSQTQSEILTQSVELTQLGDEDAGGCLSPLPPYSPSALRRVPWGRFMLSNGEPWELLPRDAERKQQQKEQQQQQPQSSFSNDNINAGNGGVSMLGLHDIQPCDVFNLYTVGRSHKADFVVPKYKACNEALQTLYNWAYAMISNQHLKIYCMLDESSPGDFCVWIEDSSGNGTIVNQTTVLRRGERRLLHSGDEICLVSPTSLRRKIRSQTTMAEFVRHFSFVFVRQKNAMPRLSLSPRRAAVNARATTTGRTAPAPTVGASTPGMRRLEEDYEVRDLLGEGTAGHVRRAIHRKTGQERAVKVIQLQPLRSRLTAGTPSDLKLVQAEAKILKGLSHPYIVQLDDVYVTQSAVYLVMELLPGGDLFDRIVYKGKYTETESRRVMRRLLAAVHYLHETQNVVHRDLKPENILLAARHDDVQVKLTDFGLAKAINDDEGCKTFCGTPQYFAPEVFRRQHTVKGRGRYGKPADMWSLGVILYVLLSGTQPETPHLDFPPDDWQGVSESAKNLIKSLLRTDPRERLTVQKASRHPWILQPDGDTHLHPLEDPLLKGCTTNFANEHDDEADSDETRSITSEGKDDESIQTSFTDTKIVATTADGNSPKELVPTPTSPLTVVNARKEQMLQENVEGPEDTNTSLHVDADSMRKPVSANCNKGQLLGEDVSTEDGFAHSPSLSRSVSKSARVSDEAEPRRPLSPTSFNTRCSSEPRLAMIPKNDKGILADEREEEPIESFEDADESISSFATTEEETMALKRAAAAASKSKRKRRRITQAAGDSLAQLDGKQQTTLSGWIKTGKNG